MRLPPGGAQDEDDTLARKARGEDLGERLDGGGAKHRLPELAAGPEDERARAVNVGGLTAIDFVVVPLVVPAVEEFGKLALAVVLGAVHKEGESPLSQALAEGIERLAQGRLLFATADASQLCGWNIADWLSATGARLAKQFLIPVQYARERLADQLQLVPVIDEDAPVRHPIDNRRQEVLLGTHCRSTVVFIRELPREQGPGQGGQVLVSFAAFFGSRTKMGGTGCDQCSTAQRKSSSVMERVKPGGIQP